MRFMASGTIPSLREDLAPICKGYFLTGPKLAAGCVVYRYDPTGAPLLLLIHDQYGRWTLPKGRLDAGESEQAARFIFFASPQIND